MKKKKSWKKITLNFEFLPFFYHFLYPHDYCWCDFLKLFGFSNVLVPTIWKSVKNCVYDIFSKKNKNSWKFLENPGKGRVANYWFFGGFFDFFQLFSTFFYISRDSLSETEKKIISCSGKCWGHNTLKSDILKTLSFLKNWLFLKFWPFFLNFDFF